MLNSAFKVKHQSGRARAGVLQTQHGEIQTPVFMPVGTRGTVKSMTTADMEELGAEIILGNTYHLYLRPGHELIEKLGGLHRFSSWKKAILTDSGGYQIFSLSKLNKVTEAGVQFKSHIDGSSHLIGPELSMQIQKSLGSDIVMCFDECPALPASEAKLRSSMELTLRWAKRCADFELATHQQLFGIVQGGLDLALRRECLGRLKEMYDFPGFAIGGLSVGEKNEEMVQLLHTFIPEMPSDKPRYLMGVGKPMDILNAVRCGVDMFDCVLPTRNARNGGVMTKHGPINIKNEQYKEDLLPLDPHCGCKICARYTRAYIRHLYTVGEQTAGHMMSYHNLHFYLGMMKDVRVAISVNRFEEYYQQFLNDYLKR